MKSQISDFFFLWIIKRDYISMSHFLCFNFLLSVSMFFFPIFPSSLFSFLSFNLNDLKEFQSIDAPAFSLTYTTYPNISKAIIKKYQTIPK